MSEKHPKLSEETHSVQQSSCIYKHLKKEDIHQLSDNLATINQQIHSSDENYGLERDIQQIAHVVDKRIVTSEENALTFLCSRPERIPAYIQRLTQQYDSWKKVEK